MFSLDTKYSLEKVANGKTEMALCQSTRDDRTCPIAIIITYDSLSSHHMKTNTSLSNQSNN